MDIGTDRIGLPAAGWPESSTSAHRIMPDRGDPYRALNPLSSCWEEQTINSELEMGDDESDRGTELREATKRVKVEGCGKRRTEGERRTKAEDDGRRRAENLEAHFSKGIYI